jgi:colanic acid/amylovoran biosynthesis glycosyltransferase
MPLLSKESKPSCAEPTVPVQAAVRIHTIKENASRLGAASSGRMSVAFFVDDFPSFTQTFVLRQIAGVIENGWPASIYALRDSGLKGTHRLIEKHRMMAKTVYLPEMPRSRRQRIGSLLSYGTRPGWMKNFRQLARTLNVFQFGRDAASLKLACRCLPFLNNGAFVDILHAQFGWLGAAVCNLRQVGALSGKVVTAFRGYDTEQYLKKFPGAYRRLFKYGDLFLPVCDYFKQWLMANGCPENKIAVLRSGIELGEFTFKVRKPEDGSPIRLLSVARMIEKKGLRYAVEAVARLQRTGKDVYYTIVGEGPLRNDLERRAAELGIADRVHMPGMKPHGEVLAEIHNSHILLAPSITAANGDHEGIPNALKEAMATGMPVISTWHSGIPELVDDDKSGFLVPEKNAEALENRLRILIDHPDLWPRMGQAGREIVENGYDIHVLNARMLELYRRPAAPHGHQ